MTAYPSAVDINKSNIDCGNFLDISYQNVRDLKTKSVEIFRNVCPLNFKIICLTEKWIN
jgi:hypothetical protein